LKDQNLDAVTAILLNGIPLIPISANVVKLFGKNEIKFQMSIKNNKLIFESQEISQDLEIQDRHLEPETINAS